MTRPAATASPVKRPRMTRSRPISCTQNQSLPCVAASSAIAAPPAPITKPKAIQRRLGDSGRVSRRSVNSSITASSVSDATCPSCQWPRAAQVALISGDGGHQDLPERRRGPQRGQDHTGCEAAEKAIQLGERMEERAVSEQATHRLVDVAQPESEEEPGEHACPGEEGAEGKKQTIGLSSDQAGGISSERPGGRTPRGRRPRAWHRPE